jgi:hypothetical protein
MKGCKLLVLPEEVLVRRGGLTNTGDRGVRTNYPRGSGDTEELRQTNGIRRETERQEFEVGWGRLTARCKPL